ncbi:unnamed protein product [Caenorhabditis bovis]|uniref:Domain of unknown function WSN domain-containing protein n=1 Tax=Caenorhabditis bovis TaxID=2654633 RepID=A0A8S1FF64_9PELO|nr:unnamed protein product [Caenorhabditis bovis]
MFSKILIIVLFLSDINGQHHLAEEKTVCDLSDILYSALEDLSAAPEQQDSLTESCWAVLSDVIGNDEKLGRIREAQKQQDFEMIRDEYRKMKERESGTNSLAHVMKDICFQLWNIPAIELPIKNDTQLLKMLGSVNLTEYPLEQLKDDEDWDNFKRETFFQMLLRDSSKGCENTKFTRKCSSIFNKNDAEVLDENATPYIRGLTNVMRQLCEDIKSFEKKKTKPAGGFAREVGKTFRWMTGSLKPGALWMLHKKRLFDVAWFAARSFQHLSNEGRRYSQMMALWQFNEVCKSAEKYLIGPNYTEDLPIKVKIGKILEKIGKDALQAFGVTVEEGNKMVQMCRRMQEIYRRHMVPVVEETEMVDIELMGIFEEVFDRERALLYPITLEQRIKMLDEFGNAKIDEPRISAALEKLVNYCNKTIMEEITSKDIDVRAAQRYWDYSLPNKNYPNKRQCVPAKYHQKLVVTFDQTNKNVQGIEPLCHLAIDVDCRKKHKNKSIEKAHDSRAFYSKLLRNINFFDDYY